MHMRYTEEDITVIVLSNNESHAEFIADGLVAIILNKSILLPYVHKELMPGKVSDKYAGQYMMQLTRPPYMATFPVEFINKNDTFYIHSVYGADIRLIPESGNKFFYGNGTDQQIEFETDSNGNILRVLHVAWGVRREVKKIE